MRADKMMRITKIAAALFIGALGGLAFLSNLFNLESAYSAVSFVVSGTEQPFYTIFGPTVSATWLTYLALFTIMTGELIVGVFGLLGAFRMLRVRNG